MVVGWVVVVCVWWGVGVGVGGVGGHSQTQSVSEHTATVLCDSDQFDTCRLARRRMGPTFWRALPTTGRDEKFGRTALCVCVAWSDFGAHTNFLTGDCPVPVPRLQR